MQLNIKSQEAYKLARELASMKDWSLTQAVINALSRAIEDEKQKSIQEKKGLKDELMAIGQQFSQLQELDPRSGDEILYDENGLPA